MGKIAKVAEKKTWLISGKLLNQLINFANEWANLEVKWGPASGQPGLNRGELKSTLTIPQWAGGSGGTGEPHPLQLYAVAVGIATKVRVRFGTVWRNVPPEVQGGSSPVDITPTDGKLVWAKATVNATTGLFVSCSIGSGSSLPDDTSTTTHWLIGVIHVDGSKVTCENSVTHSLNGRTCGADVYDWWGV
jgi:hypothetical protein